MTKKKIIKIVALSFLVLVVALLYLPILVIIVFSFTSSKIIGKWDGFTFNLYADLFKSEEILSATFNTFAIALIASVIATVVGTLTAIGINSLRKRTRTAMNGITQITVVNADIVTAVSFMFFFASLKNIGINIPRGYATLIITHTAITLPYVILAVLPKLRQLNPNIYEAGLDLGASPTKTIFSIILPQLIPAMISGFALSFTLSLDDFIITNFNKGQIDTISTLIYSKLSRSTIPEELRALSTIIFISVLLILLIVNIVSRKKNPTKAF